jgi:hypothetical protein
MKNKDLVKKVKDICDVKTLYVQGASGEFLTKANKLRLSSLTPFNSTRSAKIFAVGEDTMAFDELGLISYLTNKNFKNYGQLLECSIDISKDFSDIADGEIVFMKDRAGVYVGDGQVITASLDGVGTTTVKGWISHGKLKNVDFTIDPEPIVEVVEETPEVEAEPVEEIKEHVEKKESNMVVRGNKFRNRH